LKGALVPHLTTPYRLDVREALGFLDEKPETLNHDIDDESGIEDDQA